jgi:hypothetical protein
MEEIQQTLIRFVDQDLKIIPGTSLNECSYYNEQTHLVYEKETQYCETIFVCVFSRNKCLRSRPIFLQHNMSFEFPGRHILGWLSSLSEGK